MWRAYGDTNPLWVNPSCLHRRYVAPHDLPFGPSRVSISPHFTAFTASGLDISPGFRYPKEPQQNKLDIWAETFYANPVAAQSPLERKY